MYHYVIPWGHLTTEQRLGVWEWLQGYCYALGGAVTKVTDTTIAVKFRDYHDGEALKTKFNNVEELVDA